MVSGIPGWRQESWLVFGGAFVGLYVLYVIPIIGKLVAIILAAAWGLAGYTFAVAFGS